MVESEPKLFLIQGDVYEVEKLVAVKIVKGQKLYRVRWRGYGRESDTMEPEENLLSCKDMIADLERKIRERHDRKKNKRPFKVPPFSKELRSSVSHEIKPPSDITWQATEVMPGNSSKDTFWRDFDEGKISVSGTVYDKDMYSKVKERAERGARTTNATEGGKVVEIGQKDCPSPVPLCPKVVLKRKPVNRTSCESLAYKSSFKVKPLGIQIRKRKRYDVLRDYRRRKSRVHRKRNLDENGRRKLAFRSPDKADAHASEGVQSGSNILQELLLNDELKAIPDFVLHSEVNGSKMKSPKDSPGEETLNQGRKNHPLMCRISVQDHSVALFSPFKQSPKKEVNMKSPQKSSHPSLESMQRKMFYSLMDSILNNRLDKISRFCSHRGAVNCSKEDGTTALMLAAHLGNVSAVKLLLEANAHKDRQNRDGETALMMACRNGHAQIAKILLERGANFALTNAEGINVLRMVNQYASGSEIQDILIAHIVRVVSKFEHEARSEVRHVAQIKYALFPIQCFSLNEGPKYIIFFHHHVKLESPEKNGNQNLLFIARASIEGNSVQCQFDAGLLVRHVSINGVKQELFNENTSLVYKVTGLKNGSNKVSIITAYHPESEVKLIVCAYKVHRTTSYFPIQKIKNE